MASRKENPPASDILVTVIKEVSLEFNKQRYGKSQIFTVKHDDLQGIKKIRELLSSPNPVIQLISGLGEEDREPETVEKVMANIKELSTKASKNTTSETKKVVSPDKNIET